METKAFLIKSDFIYPPFCTHTHNTHTHTHTHTHIIIIIIIIIIISAKNESHHMNLWLMTCAAVNTLWLEPSLTLLGMYVLSRERFVPDWTFKQEDLKVLLFKMSQIAFLSKETHIVHNSDMHGIIRNSVYSLKVNGRREKWGPPLISGLVLPVSKRPCVEAV